jgi:hypothetical protein
LPWSREPRTFQGKPYEEIAVAAGILLYLQLLLAGRYEHDAWMVTAAILLTLAAAFAVA